MRVDVISGRYRGFFAREPVGTVEVAKCRISTGYLWWKRVSYGWAVMQVDIKFENGPLGVDSRDVWRMIEWFNELEEAHYFIDNL